MPYMFSRHTLHELDAADYEGAPLASEDEAPGPGEAAELELTEQACAAVPTRCLCHVTSLLVAF